MLITCWDIRIPVFSLVSEKIVQGQGHRGQGHQCQRSRSKVISKGHSVKGARHGRFHILNVLANRSMEFPLRVTDHGQNLSGNLFSSGWYRIQLKVVDEYDEEFMCLEVKVHVKIP